MLGTMTTVQVEEVIDVLNTVATYNKEIVTVLQKLEVAALRFTHGFTATSYFVNRTATSLTQLLTLLDKEAESIKQGKGQTLFSDEGLQYALTLGKELAVPLAKLESTVADGCLSSKDRREKKKASRKAARKNKTQKSTAEKPPIDLKLDGKVFTQNAENTKWTWVEDQLDDDLVRLFKLQHHLILVFQVVTVGLMTHDIASGNADLKSIVKHHKRIESHAEFMGIEAEQKWSRRSRYRRRYSFSSGSSSSRSDSSSEREIIIREPRSSKVIRAVDPPSYSCSDSKPPLRNDFTGPISPNWGFQTPPGKLPTLSIISPGIPTPAVQKPANSKEPQKIQVVKPPIPNPDLPNPAAHGFGWKLKSLLRSTSSLSAELAQTLGDTDAHLNAFIIQKRAVNVVPHSAFKSIEATYLRFLLRHLNDNSCYKTFTTLDQDEHYAMADILNQFHVGGRQSRQLIALKILNENKSDAWMGFLGRLLKNGWLSEEKGRTILAVTVEKLVDGRPMDVTHFSFHHPPPPPPRSMFPGPLARGPPGPPPAPRGPPGPPPAPRAPPGPPPAPRPAPPFSRSPPSTGVRNRARSTYDSDYSNSDSDVSFLSSMGIRTVRSRYHSQVSSRLRRKAERYDSSDSCSDSDTEDEDEDVDVVDVNVKMERGGDVVSALLELWTPRKEKVVSS